MATAQAGKRRGRRALIIVGSIVGALALTYGILFTLTGSSQLARAVVWFDADTGDIHRFPYREVAAGTPSDVPEALDDTVPTAFARIDPNLGGGLGEVGGDGSLEGLLAGTDSTALVVVKDGVLVYEWYGDGFERDTLQTCFSVSKSFLSTLIGLAIRDGYIASLEDPITDYVPELLERDPRFADITLRNLVTMSSGLEYRENMNPFGDAATTYYAPDLRAAGLSAVVETAPGEQFLYNNYNPLLLGMALERATGMQVTDYMSAALWVPLGAGADASWSLDSTGSGFEKMESGFNARPVDLARFGTMFANGGVANGRQVVPAQWIAEATAVEVAGDPSDFYQYFWWIYPPDPQAQGASADFAARGNFGQVIYVVPDENVVIVRMGSGEGGVAWPWLLGTIAREMGALDGAPGSP